MPIDLLDATAPQPAAQPTDLLNAAGVAPQFQGQSVGNAPGNPTSWVEQFAHELTGGLFDKGKALAQAAGLTGGGVNAPTFSDRYHKSLTNARNNYEDYAVANPGAAYAAKAAGVIAPMFMPELKGAQAVGEGAAAIGNSAFKSARMGALFGGAYGLGSTNDESLKQDLEATGLGAVTGGALGGALNAGVSLAGVPVAGVSEARRALSPTETPNIASRILNNTTGGKLPNFEPAPLPGMTPTAGQASNDPGLLWLERSMRESSPLHAEMAAKTQTNNNQAITTAIKKVGDTTADANQAMSDAIDRVNLEGKAAYQAAWKKAGIDEATAVPTSPLKQNLTDWYNGLSKSERKVVDPDLFLSNGEGFNPLGEFGPQESLKEFQDFRAGLGDQIRAYARSGETNKARILGGAMDHTTDFLENPPDTGFGSSLNRDPEQIANYNAARDATKNYKQTFNTPANVRNVLGVDRFGADKVPVSATADQFIKSGKGGPEALNSYLNTMKKTDANGAVSYDPEGMQAARDAFAKKFLDYTQTTALDGQGTPLVSRAKTTNFLDDYRHVVNSKLFTEPQRQMFESIQKATDMAARTGQRMPGAGSDTFQKLAGDKFLDVMLSPGAGRLVRQGGGAVGGLIGGASGGPVAIAAGIFGGSKGADALLQKLYAAPRQQAMDLVTAAVHDPDIAKALMMKASPANSKLLKPATRTKMLGILGAQPVAPLGGALNSQ